MAEPATDIHYSSCAVHNMPAYPAGPCDCGLEDRLRARIDAERDARERAEARVKVLEGALREAHRVALDAPELNMSNYDVDDVSALNEAMIAVHATLDTALKAREGGNG